jgi:tRNA threonylcarbamoyladenosine biosynthesis protein TsaE
LSSTTELLTLPDASATEALGARIATASLLAAGLPLRCYLHGDLGSGKTTLTRGLLHALGVTGRIKSPTYTLVEPYALSGNRKAYHLDLYRFEHPQEWDDAGLDELLQEPAIMMVEWPDKAHGRLPPADLDIRLAVQGQERTAQLDAHTAAGHAVLTHVCR